MINKSFTINGADGNHLTVSETTERDQVLISIQSNDRQGGVANVRLTTADWKELCDLKYSVDAKSLPSKEIE